MTPASQGGSRSTASSSGGQSLPSGASNQRLISTSDTITRLLSSNRVVSPSEMPFGDQGKESSGIRGSCFSMDCAHKRAALAPVMERHVRRPFKSSHENTVVGASVPSVDLAGLEVTSFDTIPHLEMSFSGRVLDCSKREGMFRPFPSVTVASTPYASPLVSASIENHQFRAPESLLGSSPSVFHQLCSVKISSLVVRTRRQGDGVNAPDATWSPLLSTPNHPEYPSGHSVTSGAAAVRATTAFLATIRVNTYKF